MVIVLDKYKKPLGVCSEHRARQLMEQRRACVYRYFPFAIILKDKDVREMDDLPSFRIKIDPGSKYTGLAVVRDSDNAVVLFMQIEHRGELVVKNMKTRSGARRNRRQRETRYRRCKYINHYLPKDSKYKVDSDRPEGWLPPSVKSIGDNIISWVRRLGRLLNITSCSFEAVRFDTQLLDNPDIEGIEYQQGTLFGYELREYLLDRYGHQCQYCGGESGDTILEWEHIKPKSKGGSDSVKNATLACHTCNQDKGNLSLDEWATVERGIKGPAARKKLAEARLKGIEQIKAHKAPKVSDRYCAWANSSRRYIEKALFGIFGDVECASGGRTKFNRVRLGLPKDHHYDALCVGTVPDGGYRDLTGDRCLYAKAMGRGTRFRGKINSCGIIVKKLQKVPKRINGFRNGDIVAADVPKGKYKGHHVGRVMTRQSGNFDIRTMDGDFAAANYKYCRLLQYNNGYQYRYVRFTATIPLGNK